MLVLYTIMSLSWLYLDSGPMAGEKKVVKVKLKVLLKRVVPLLKILVRLQKCLPRLFANISTDENV